MKQIKFDNQEIKNPESAATELGAISNESYKKTSTQDSENHPPKLGEKEGEHFCSLSKIQNAASDYIQRGWSPLPIPFQEKAPRIMGWQNLHLQEEDLPTYFKDERQNIGVLLGEPSGGLVDIDLDAPQAVQLADEFLPITKCIFGRASKPRSHRLYVTNPSPATKKYTTSEGVTLVEMRSTGAQTVFPPSVHQTGESISFEQNEQPITVTAEALEEAVAELAAASLLVRHWPKQGTRQDTAMALAGGLAKGGWEPTEIERFIRAVAKAAGDDETRQRLNCAKRTTSRTQSHKPVTGWPRLAQLIGKHVVDRVRGWLLGQQTAKERIGTIRTEKGIKESEKNRRISEIVIDELLDSGVFYKTPHELYYFDQLDCRLFPLDDAEFRARINDHFDINGSEPSWRFVFEDLNTEALLRGQETTIHRFAFYDKDKGILYVYKGKEKVFQVNSEGWSVVSNGTDGVLFLNPDMELVEVSVGEPDSKELESVIAIPNFGGSGHITSEQERQLYRLWIFSLFFESLLPTKPILFLFGVKGSGKTMGLRALLRAFLGKKGQVLTLSKEKQDAFLAAVTSHHLVAFDNLDSVIPWLPDHLATAATGGDIALRKLYTTNAFVSFPVRCFLALTARDPNNVSRDDVADRLLTLRVDRIEAFKPENQVLSDIDTARPKIWAELLKDLQHIVKELETAKTYPSTHRLADFASLALNIGPVLGLQEDEIKKLLEGMDSEKTEFALEHNPLYPLLETWVQKDGMGEREWIDSKTLFNEIVEQANLGPKFPFKNAGALSRALKNLKTDLQGWIEVIGPEKIPGGNNKTFWQIRPGSKLELTLKEKQEDQPE